MSSNKYLEKIAGTRFRKAIDFADDVLGVTSRKLRNQANIAADLHARGIGVKEIHNMADEAGKRSTSARVKAGIGTAAVGTAGFLGIHKYQQHKDNAIMAKIDSMYANDNQD